MPTQLMTRAYLNYVHANLLLPARQRLFQLDASGCFQQHSVAFLRILAEPVSRFFRSPDELGAYTGLFCGIDH